MKIIVTAPRGKMGRLIIAEIINSRALELAGCIGPKSREYIGMDIGNILGLGREYGALCYDSLDTIIEACHVVVDFSTIDLSLEVLETCTKNKVPLICGTTGFSAAEKKKFTVASKEIPVLMASNTSYMVNVMMEMLRLGAEALGNKVKVEILDFHDEKKLDAPSGTAKEFGEIISQASNKNLDEIAFHSIRAGDTPSSHTVYLGTMGERMEITHHAYNWKPFAIGAIDGARFLHEQTAGLYTMEDVIKWNQGK